MIIVTGAKGQLGSDVCETLKEKGIDFLGIDIQELDITDEKRVDEFFGNKTVDALIHCAAYVAVDKAEDEKELCFSVNEKGTANLARACKKHGIKMLYVSTDYVFSGLGVEPFEPDSEKSPLNAYGLSKLKGEQAIQEILDNYFIVRTSWVFGEKNTNFIATILRLSESKSELSVVNDQIGSPTYSKDLARLICQMIQTDKYGIYHGTNEGFCSWFELAKKAVEIAKKDVKLIPVESTQFPTRAVRPKNSRLSKDCLTAAGFDRLPSWENAVERYLKNRS